MLVKCNACKGAKKVKQLGWMEGDCKTCGGSGYVSIKEAIEAKESEDKPKSKKG